MQLVAGDVDPQVHRVQSHEARAVALLADLELKAGLDVGQEQDLRSARGLGQLGREVLEHVQLRVERLAAVQIPAVPALPEERPAAGHALDVVDRGSPGLASTVISASPKSSPTGPTIAHVIEERRGEGEVGGGAAEHPLAHPERRLHGVEGERPDDRDAHTATASSSPRPAASRSSAATSVRSHVKSSSSRPK